MDKRLISALALAAFALAACSTNQESGVNTVLTARKVATAPVLKAGDSDPAWAGATPMSIELSGGENFGGKGGTTALLKAVYSGDTLYMLVQYADPTNSLRRGPYQKQADGSWKKLADPQDKGGDDNVYYEDKWAMIWPINNSVKGFAENGCGATCHAGEPGKPYGNKYTAAPGELADMWHMKGSRTAPLGKVDDQYLDHTRFDAKASPNAGRKSDPGPAEYNGFGLVNGKPQYMSKDARAANAGGTYYIVRGNEVAFDDTKFKAGDEVASYLINPLSGDRGDINVVTTWRNGILTSVVSRKLVTGSRFDVQFGDLTAQYPFGFAAFDNAQVRHAVHWNPVYLRFAN